MRVAVCVFGEIRGDAAAWRRLHANLVAPNEEADVFIHNVYYEPDFIERLPDATPVEKAFLHEYYDKKGVHCGPPPELLSILRPVRYLLERRPSYPLDRYEGSIAPKFSKITWQPGSGNNRLEYHAIMSQAESRDRVLSLRREHERMTGVAYDVVILTRLDVNIVRPLQISNHPRALMARAQGPERIYEQLVFGPPAHVDVIGDFFAAAPNLYAELCDDAHPLMMNEYFLPVFLRRRGVPIEHADVPLDFAAQSNGLYRSGGCV